MALEEKNQMGQQIIGNMWCNACSKPIVGIWNQHAIRNAVSVLAVPATGGVS